MFSHASFGTSPFDSSSSPRVYVDINNYLVFTQELFVEGALLVSVDTLNFSQTLLLPTFKKIKKVTNTISFYETVLELRTRYVHKLNSNLQYNQSLYVPDVIRKHYEIPESVAEFIQTLHQVALPKISIVDSLLTFTQSLKSPTTQFVHKIDILNYVQSLFITKHTQIVKSPRLLYAFDLLKPEIRYINTISNLVEFHQVLIDPRNVIVNSVDQLHYEMTLNKPIINSYELFIDMFTNTYWKVYTIQREGNKLLVIQEVEHSANLLEISDE